MHSFCASETTRVLVTTFLSCANAAADREIAAPITIHRSVIAMSELHCVASPARIVHQAKRRPAGRISRQLEQTCRAHAAADAHRHHDVPDSAAPALDERVPGEARARRPVGMADRDRAAVYVQALVG